MKKLSLNPDKLAVDSFEATAVRAESNTVEGRMATALECRTPQSLCLNTWCVSSPCAC